MQTSQLRQIHVALLHCHYCCLYYIPTSIDIAFFFIENLHFSLISFMFINKSSVSEFDCVFLYHMTNDHTLVYTLYYQDFFVRPYFCESFSVFSFHYLCFHQDFSITLQLLFQSPLHFVQSFRLGLFDRLFSLTGLVLVRIKTLRNNFGKRRRTSRRIK